MIRVALWMLLGDPTKCLGLVLGLAFSTLLICQQVSIFFGLLGRASSVVNDVREADLWVMDPSVKTIDVPYPLRSTALPLVRGVEGVAWAVPFFKATVRARTRGGDLENAIILGIDDASLIGVPDAFKLGEVEDLAQPDAIAVNPAGFRLLFPGAPLGLGRELELNDRRARIVAIVDAAPAFAANLTIYTRYDLATRFTNNGRNRLSFVLARAAAGLDPQAVADEVARRTGLKCITTPRFRRESIAYVLKNTGIPVSFGTVVVLGVIVGMAVVGLTFHQFILENMKQYAALKAIGVRDGRLLLMTLSQAGFVAVNGYGLGLGAAALFFHFAPRRSDALRGFYLLPEVAAGVAVAALVMVLCATLLSMRRVLVVDPATVFRG